MTRRPNPKYLTNEQRIASVDFQVRQRLIDDNRRGVGMKHLAVRYGIAERTVRAIIHDSHLQPPTIVVKPPRPNDVDLWERPDLWHEYGLKGPCTPRMVQVT